MQWIRWPLYLNHHIFCKICHRFYNRIFDENKPNNSQNEFIILSSYEISFVILKRNDDSHIILFQFKCMRTEENLTNKMGIRFL